MAEGLKGVPILAAAAREIAGHASDADRRLDQAVGNAFAFTTRLEQHSERTDRLLQDLRNNAALTRHAAHDAMKAAEEWRTRSRRLAFAAVPLVLVFLLGMTFLAPRLLVVSETLCALAGASWFEEPEGTRRGCWMEARR